jgi:hypothetical protein
VFSCVIRNQGTSQKPCIESNSKRQGAQKESKKNNSIYAGKHKGSV